MSAYNQLCIYTTKLKILDALHGHWFPIQSVQAYYLVNRLLKAQLALIIQLLLLRIPQNLIGLLHL